MRSLTHSLKVIREQGGILRWLSRTHLDVVLVFVGAFAIATYWQLFHQTIGDPDGFYHAKMALFLRDGIVLQAMPWMQISTLRDSFTDHHFLYHALLVPFVVTGNPLVGVKLASVMFTAGFFTTFYWFLKRCNVTAPLFWAVLLMACSPFTFRLALIKANSLSLIALLFILYALFEKRRGLLIALNAIYVWLYGGWLIAPIAAIAYGIGTLLERHFVHTVKPWWRRVFRQLPEKTAAFQLFLAAIVGAVGGIVVNPYFPHNLSFYWQQVWDIAIVNQGANNVNVGGEWSSLAPAEFVAFFVFIPVVFMVGVFLVAASSERISRRTWTFLALSLLTAVFTIKSRRYIELSAPLTVLFSASAWSDVMPKGILNAALSSWHGAQAWVPDYLRASVVLGALAFIALPNIGVWTQIEQTRNQASNGIVLNRYESAARWLREHTPQGSVVLHSDWDDWPILFYHNDWNYYIVGLDPTFMYNESPTLYRAYADLTSSGTTADLVTTVTKDLRAQYVLIEKDHEALYRIVSTNVYFRQVYEDDEAWIYQYRPE